MTTDVINGVPRELLEQIEALLALLPEAKTIERVRALLATAQPVSDGGEREAFESIYGVIRVEDDTTPEDQTIYKLERAAFHSGAVWQARAAQPQQAVAVTDAMVLAASGVCVSFRGHYGEHNDYLDDCTARQIIEAALSAHKTGEEE